MKIDEKAYNEMMLDRDCAAREGDRWREVAELAHAFLASLPKGWLAHTTGDIGALNDFYIKYREAKKAEAGQ